MRWLKHSNILDKVRHVVMMQLFFHSTEAAINKKTRAEASTVVDKLLDMLSSINKHECYKRTYNYIKKNVREMLLGVVSYVQDRSEYLETPTHRSTNVSEGFNNKIKGMLNREPVTISQLISELWKLSHAQLVDIPRSWRSGEGEFILRDSAKQHL